MEGHEGQQHDRYGKQVLQAAAGNACQLSGPSTQIDYGTSTAVIDGTVDSLVAVEMESRTGKQVRGAVLDLILHRYPKKLLILIPMYIQRQTPDESRYILGRFISPENFRVVLLAGTGNDLRLEQDAGAVRNALVELGCPLGQPASVPSKNADEARVSIGITEAARVLQELGLCKSFGPSGRINGPNCQRFGHRGPSTGRWSWDVAELIAKAQEKECASPQGIQSIAERYGLPRQHM